MGNNTQTTYPTTFMNKPASYMSGTKYFDSASSWYPSLEGSTASSNSDFLTNYFMSAMQTFTGSSGTPPVPQFSTALSGTDSVDANVQIFEKSSTYFVSTTHIMYYLELAENALAKGDTAGAKNHFDSIAAVYFGCGDTNPVPLPVYTPDTIVTTSPQVATQITWTADATQKDGDKGTVYSLYNLVNKRASNYGLCGTLKTGSCSTDKIASTTSGSVTVGDLNLVVADALNYGTSGPSAAAVNNIRDSINTVNAQAAQRYIARVSLDANVPGNGLGGSTKRLAVDSPASSKAAAAASSNANGLVPTACGGGLYYLSFAGNPVGGANTAAPGGAGQAPGGVVPGATTSINSGTTLSTARTAETTTAYNAAFPGWGGPLVNAQCGTSANSTGTVASNTALVRSVMNPVTMTQNTDGSAPYKLKGTAVGSGAGGGITGVALYAVSAQDVTAATRGETTFDSTSGYYAKKTPIGCIDKSVRFNDIKVTATAATGTGK